MKASQSAACTQERVRKPEVFGAHAADLAVDGDAARHHRLVVDDRSGPGSASRRARASRGRDSDTTSPSMIARRPMCTGASSARTTPSTCPSMSTRPSPITIRSTNSPRATSTVPVITTSSSGPMSRAVAEGGDASSAATPTSTSAAVLNARARDPRSRTRRSRARGRRPRRPRPPPAAARPAAMRARRSWNWRKRFSFRISSTSTR